VIAGYAYQQGDVVTDAAVPLTDGKVHVHNAVLAYAIKLYASKAVSTRIGGDFDLIGLGRQVRWGGGL
jgi:hypothetical protein